MWNAESYAFLTSFIIMETEEKQVYNSYII